MLPVLAAHWSLLLVRGTLAVLFGVIVLVWPQLTRPGLTMLFGAYTAFDGIAGLMIAYSARLLPGAGSLLFEALVRIGTGVVVLTATAPMAARLPTVLAGWAALCAIGELAAAGVLRRELTGAWPLPLAGTLSLIVAAFLAANPAAGVPGIVWLLGPYAILYGFTILGFTYRLCQMAREMARA